MIRLARSREAGFLLGLCLLALSCQGTSSVSNPPAPVPVPTARVALAGNGFITHAEPGATEEITGAGLANWTSPQTVASVYFRVGQAGQLHVGLVGSLNGSSSSTVQVTVNGQPFAVSLSGTSSRSYDVGTVAVAAPGYVQVNLQGLSKAGGFFGDISALELSGSATATNLLYARDAKNYYWSRRGPSVHMSYDTPDRTEYFYNEVTVPVGQDAVGSYFMANGFGEGYFGMQVNSTTERRVLFSVWDPASGGRTTLERKGPEVVDNAFGGEGTGGQSYLLFNWVAGKTYRFLTQAWPDGAGSTLYSAWFFAPEAGSWRFIATWKRPNTSTYLVGCYSFLENFLDFKGYLGRKALYGNQWSRSAAGVWTESTRGRFTGDDTANKQQRMDFAGGLQDGQFFLKNGGFFADSVPVNQEFLRPSTGRKPAVDVALLP